jgi:hypothetical protein
MANPLAKMASPGSSKSLAESVLAAAAREVNPVAVGLISKLPVGPWALNPGQDGPG